MKDHLINMKINSKIKNKTNKKWPLITLFVVISILGFLFGVNYTYNADVYRLNKEIGKLNEYKGLYLKSEFYRIQRDKKFETKVAYWSLIKKYAKQYGIDPAIPATVQILETGGMPFDQRVIAVSHAGAIGLQQIMPFHAAANGYKEIDLYNPHINIKISCMLLSQLYKKYDGDMDKILSAYNGGPRQAKRKNISRIPETKSYVIRGLKQYNKLAQI